MTEKRAPEPLDVAASALLKRLNQAALVPAIALIAELEIPDLLADGEQTAGALARKTGSDPQALYRMLRALAADGVFEEKPGRVFKNTALAEHLRKKHPNSLHGIARMAGASWNWNTWGHLPHSIRTGQSAFANLHGCGLFEFLKTSPPAARIFHDAMGSGARSAAADVLSAYAFGARPRHFVDVGGGVGHLLFPLLATHIEHIGTLFDVPNVAPAAEEGIRANALETRCAFVGGNFFDHVPPGADTYILRNILHDWDDERARRILDRCASAMGAESRLIIIERVLDVGGLGALHDLQMLLLTSGGKERTLAEFEELLAGAGLTLDETISTPAQRVLLIARKSQNGFHAGSSTSP
ncbi:methyltransferase [bacterium]|nr:methyltransferase [bacterium]